MTDPDSSKPRTAKPITYRDAGVDIDAGNALVDAIKPMVKKTVRPGVIGAIGGFGGLFDLKQAGFNDPVLVAANDGVGTKLKIAIETGRHDTIGIDLVAMCVNDLIVQGAEPLFFLDYLATAKLDHDIATAVIQGIADGCHEAGCALIGGETAEMPGMYSPGDYDLAGFSVGAAERANLLPVPGITSGDLLIGLPSSGFHSNGFSLVRRLVDAAKLEWDAPAPWQQTRSVGEALLEPTRIYVKPILAALDKCAPPAGGIKALAHITGGGLTENLPRVLPNGLTAKIDLSTWTPPPVFSWAANTGTLDDTEMLRTFNCGIGMIVVADQQNVANVMATLEAAGEKPLQIGALETAARSSGHDQFAGPRVTYTGTLRLTR